MKRTHSVFYKIIWLILLLSPIWIFAQSTTMPGESLIDTANYANTPAEYEPYHRFENPYKRYFIDTLAYHGYGRHIPEPQHIDTVKIGFIGPIVLPGADPVGNLTSDELRVGDQATHWDGYTASYIAPMGIKMLQGASLAVELANLQGGYRGKIPYRLVVRNDNGNWRSSGYETIWLAYKDKVWAIIGTIDSENSHVAIRAGLKAEIPMMNTADTDPTFVETNIPWVFRCITDDRQMCYMLADFAFKKLNLKRVAALRAANRYGRVSIDEFRDAARRLGYPFLVELQYEDGDLDFTKQLQKIKSLNADAVITYGNVKESALILKQMRLMGMDQWYLGSDRMVVPEFTEIVGDQAGNVAAAYPYDPRSTDPAYIKFVKEFKSRFGEIPETYAAHAYDGTKMVIRAIETAGLNRALIRDELVRMSGFRGVTGEKEFDAVFSNRTPALIALLRDGKFEFYNHQEIFSDNFEVHIRPD